MFLDGSMKGIESVTLPVHTLPTRAVLGALETREQLLLKERECLELGKRLATQIRAFAPDELRAYAERTQAPPQECEDAACPECKSQ